jgi:hypothetical protein
MRIGYVDNSQSLEGKSAQQRCLDFEVQRGAANLGAEVAHAVAGAEEVAGKSRAHLVVILGVAHVDLEMAFENRAAELGAHARRPADDGQVIQRAVELLAQ